MDKINYQRDEFISEIYKHAKKNKKIYFLSADFGAPALDNFRFKLKEQFLHLGICEQNMVDFACGMALEKNLEICKEMKKSNYEIASHGWRWIDYQNVSKSIEKKHMQKAIGSIKKIFGKRPVGWYTGRCSPNTLDLVIEDGGFLYSSDTYSDDLPYWEIKGEKKQLMIPYTLDNNDMRFLTNQGFNSGEQFFNYLKDSFDTLYEEGNDNPKMMSIGLHCRIIGKAGRIQSLKKFLDYITNKDKVWVCKREEIANHWINNHNI